MQRGVQQRMINFGSVSNTAWSRFSSSVRARTNLAQVLHDVRADAALTFDWVFLLLVAAFVAAIGLVENSTVIIVASMLISPLMGPITAGTLGTAVKDRSLQLMGVKNEFLGLFLSLVMGFLFGLTICAIDERYGVAVFYSRCKTSLYGLNGSRVALQWRWPCLGSITSLSE
ncbi:hypothetical protein HF086_005118 [Spodoptera exigua]|uniref:Uncharacterized protein n=1 Tax=Spodoptera exigua TaxID=7107 RepID=A0A922SKI2_SPOEX|nr:hypothetical protein HF086_005118 [Spodoptera exigua]